MYCTNYSLPIVPKNLLRTVARYVNQPARGTTGTSTRDTTVLISSLLATVRSTWITYLVCRRKEHAVNQEAVQVPGGITVV